MPPGPAEVTITGCRTHLGGDIMADTTKQDNWRHCNKCFGLWWNGAPTNGVCPAGGAHHAGGSWNFYVPANPAEHL